MAKATKKHKKIQLDRVCRACLSERGHLRDIVGTKIPFMMEFCASVQVDEQDDLPKQICVTCFHLIAKFYSFKRKLERSDKNLRNYIAQNRAKRKRDVLCEAVNDAEIESSLDAPIGGYEELMVKTDGFLDFGQEENDGKLIFTEGPPPLIPIETNKVLRTESEGVCVLANAPPLVPIKPTLVPIEIEKLVPRKLKLECTVCGEEFNCVMALRQHRKFQCQSSGLQCNICKKDFKDSKKLIGHLKGHMVAKDHACKICGKRYPNPSTLKVHMRTHTGERPFKCQVCDKGFVRWAGVVSHMKTHNLHKPYKCETCGKGFKIPSNLERHKILHSGNFPFCCNFCGKTFSQAENLQLHIRTYHTFEKPFLCNECGKGFVSSTRLNRHMWVHSGYKPYRCKLCDKSYSNSNDLKNHLRLHAGGHSEKDKPHVCDVCNMRFYHACRLAKHVKIHEKKTCQHCGKIFPCNFLLNKHIQVKHISQEEMNDDKYIIKLI